MINKKKKREICSNSLLSGIAKRLAKMNKETKPHAVKYMTKLYNLCCTYIYEQNER